MNDVKDLDLFLKEVTLSGYTIKGGNGAWCIPGDGRYRERHAVIETPSCEFASHRDKLIIRLVDDGTIELEMRFGSSSVGYKSNWPDEESAIWAIGRWCRKREP